MTNGTRACFSLDLVVEAIPNVHTAMQVDLAGPSGTISGVLEQRNGTSRYRFTITPSGFVVGTHIVTVYPLSNPIAGKLVGSFDVLATNRPFCR